MTPERAIPVIGRMVACSTNVLLDLMFNIAESTLVDYGEILWLIVEGDQHEYVRTAVEFRSIDA
jgi:hypothetical protein